MAQVALAQKPLNVTVGSRANPFAAQRGTLVAVALRVGLVALLAVFAKDKRAGGSCFGLASQWILTRMIFGRNALPMRGRDSAESNRRGERNQQNSKARTHHRAPPLDE